MKIIKWTKLYDIWKRLAVKSTIKSFNVYVALGHEDYYFFIEKNH